MSKVTVLEGLNVPKKGVTTLEEFGGRTERVVSTNRVILVLKGLLCQR